LAPTAVGEGALPGPHQSTVSVGGAVATPATYSLAQLDALPQTTFTVNGRRWRGSRSHTDSGVSLEDLVNAAAPTEPSAKNALLRLTVTVSSRRAGSGTFALGELDSSFGNHPAYLTLLRDGHTLRAPELVVPGDVNSARTVLRSSGRRSPTYSASSTAIESPRAPPASERGQAAPGACPPTTMLRDSLADDEVDQERDVAPALDVAGADERSVDASSYALVHGVRRTRATLAAWRGRPWPVLRRWLVGALAAAALLLGAVLAIALIVPSSAGSAGLGQPPFVVGSVGDVVQILRANMLVLGLHAMACVAGFIAGSSLPLQAEHHTGWVRLVHERGQPVAMAFVVCATGFSLSLQAFTLGTAAAQDAATLHHSPALLLLGLHPTPYPS
jgi:hypothetical protein